MSRTRILPRLLFVFMLGLVVFAARQAPAYAVSTTLVINEVDYDQPSTDTTEFIEIKNVSASAINLDPYSVIFWNAAAAPAGASYRTVELPNVSLAAGDYYVICGGTVTNCDLDDTVNTDYVQNGAPDALGLWLSTTLIDAISYEGNSQAPYTEGTGAGTDTAAASPAPAESLSRCADGADTDNNSADFLLRTSTPGTTNDCPVADADPMVSSTTPADNATNVAANTDITITFSEAVTVSGAWYTISCGTSGAHTATVSGGPTSYTLNPDADFTAGEVCTVTIESTLVADQDGTAQNMAADYEFDFTIDAGPQCGLPGATPIHDIQGNGALSPEDGNVHTIEGIVVGDFQFDAGVPNSELNGYYVQEEDADADADPNTSEGIFVFEGSNPSTPAVNVGDKVRVTGTVDEFEIVHSTPALETPDKLTELVGPLTVEVCSTGDTLPTAATINLPVGSVSDFERYEGMAVFFPQELTVTEIFTLGRFGEVRLAADGRLWIPTHEAEPGAAAAAVEAANILRSFVLDDGFTTQNPDPVRYPEPGGLSAINTLRGGDTTTGLKGVMHWLDTSSTDGYRVHPTETVAWDHENPRPTDAPVISGTLKVVGSNTLNYFTTVDAGPDVCGPAANQDCRGADSAQEFTRQHDKLINMLLELDADIVGLNELENNAAAGPANDGTDPVLESIVDALNAALGAGTYAFIDAGVIGTDAIKVGMIYKPASVTPVGSFSILTSSYDPDFIDTRNRPVLAQTFQDNNSEIFTVAVAHLKSKSSACGGAPDDQPDSGGGLCNGTRTAAAEVMVDWFAEPTVNNGDPDILLVGDLNSYAKEDPIDVFVNAGYVDLAATLDEAYSYVFDGEWGYLDYAMASPTMAAQVAGVAEWHINADEPIALDYNTEFKSAGQIASFYDDDPFRVSDHDPIIVGLGLDSVAPDVTINQASGQSDPTSSSPILFTVVFTETVTGFETGDVTLSGTAGATTATVTETGPMDGTTYEVAVSGMTGSGTVIASIAADVAEDAAGNGNTASTSTDNTVTYVQPAEPETEIFVSTLAAGTVGAVNYGGEDILYWDGSAWSVWFDGTDAGLTPNGKAKHNINAFYIPEVTPSANSDTVLMSFAQNARIVPGITGKVDGMDLVTWDGSQFSLTFDGQDVGLTAMTNEKIDGLHELDPSLAPEEVEGEAGGSCLRLFLISTQGAGKVPEYDGTQLNFGGEDVLGFCATQLGATTTGLWYLAVDGSDEGVKPNAITSISASEDGQTIYLTTRAAFNVDSATGGHSMVYAYDVESGEFSGPYFSAPATGLMGKVDGLHTNGDLIE